jgi:murein DD-endopeptidase
MQPDPLLPMAGVGTRLLVLAALGSVGLACRSDPEPVSVAEAASAVESATVAAASATLDVELEAALPEPALVAPRPAGVAPPGGAATPPSDGTLRFLRAEVRSNLEAAMTEQVGGELGPALAQVVKRSLVWWANPRSDLRKGDRLDVAFATRGAEEPLVHALWFTSQKFGKTFAAVRHQPEGARFARFYQADGSELELQLVGGPMREYEQITSLLSDGRGHKGVDFKAPVGTPIYAPFDGTIARVNWSRRRNGNCLDLVRPNGDHVLLLHLDRMEPGIRAGVRVKAGAPIARSGNTGRSTAPHLHYQLQNGPRGRVLDPFRVHPTRRAKLPPAETARVAARLAELGARRPSAL